MEVLAVRTDWGGGDVLGHAQPDRAGWHVTVRVDRDDLPTFAHRYDEQAVEAATAELATGKHGRVDRAEGYSINHNDWRLKAMGRRLVKRVTGERRSDPDYWLVEVAVMWVYDPTGAEDARERVRIGMTY